MAMCQYRFQEMSSRAIDKKYLPDNSRYGPQGLQAEWIVADMVFSREDISGHGLHASTTARHAAPKLFMSGSLDTALLLVRPTMSA